jgi:hypothetical protein
LTLHEDEVFNQRHTLFLVAEAMLAVAYATALTASENSVALTIGILGLVLTGAWFYVSYRHGAKVEYVQKLAKSLFRDYRQAAELPERRWTPLPSRIVAGFVVPGLVVALWVALLIPRLT